MSQFITPENQKLIWTVISKNSIVNDFFTVNPNQKETWFKSIIQLFYEQNRSIVLNQTDLLMLNKSTISYMVQNIKEITAKNTLKMQQVPLEQNFLKPYSITENKVEKIGNQFNEKQVEYNSLFDRKIPESPEFAEKQDKPLSNMDELIQQHLREREEELRKYAPLPLVTPVPQPSQQPSKLKIGPPSDTINIQIEEINETDNDNKTRKTVSWSDNVNAEKLETQQKEIELLKLQLIELQERVKNLEENPRQNNI
jgi:hypothetical protein